MFGIRRLGWGAGGAPGRRERQRIAQTLRRMGSLTRADRPFCVLLTARAEVAQTELQALADLVERLPDVPPDWWRAISELLGDGRRSPLYNPAIHPSELRATLFYLNRPGDPMWSRPADPPAAAVVPLAGRTRARN